MANSVFDIEIDELTLAAARKGDMAACERIYRCFQKPAYNVAMRVCHCPETAQDICQEAFISAFRRMAQFRGDAPFWGWMRRIVVNHSISALRKKPKGEQVELKEYQAWEKGDQSSIGDAMDLESALAHLADEDRTIVWLHDVEGYRHREIAEMFGRTESFSKTRLARAREKLRVLITEPVTEPSHNVCV